MERPGRRGNDFVCPGSHPAARANDLERLGLFFDGNSGTATFRLPQAKDGAAERREPKESNAQVFVTGVFTPDRIADMDSVSSPSPPSSSERWRFLRDVAVFQLKLFLDNVRDFALVPISLFAALIDLVYRGEREGALFYKVLRWGAHSEEVIDVYSAIEHHPPGSFRVNPAYTVDAVVARLEGVVVRECDKGGTAASIKSAMDRAIDQLHRETQETGDRALEAMARAADKLSLKIGTLPSEQSEKDEEKPVKEDQ